MRRRGGDDQEAGHRQRDAHQRRRPVAVPGGDDQAAEPGAERVGHVEAGVVHGGARASGPPRHVHQPQLEVHHEHGAEERDEERDRQQPVAVRRECPERQQHQAHAERGAEQRAQDRPVRQLSGSERAGDHAEAEDEQEERHRAVAEAADLGHGRRDVGEHREHATEADRAGEQGQPDLEVGERLQLAQARGLADRPGSDGTKASTIATVTSESTDDRPVRRAPAEVLAHPGGPGDADHVGDREADHHQRHGAALAALGRQAGGDQGGDAEVGAVRQPVEEAGEQQQLEAGRPGR